MITAAGARRTALRESGIEGNVGAMYQEIINTVIEKSSRGEFSLVYTSEHLGTVAERFLIERLRRDGYETHPERVAGKNYLKVIWL